MFEYRFQLAYYIYVFYIYYNIYIIRYIIYEYVCVTYDKSKVIWFKKSVYKSNQLKG